VGQESYALLQVPAERITPALRKLLKPTDWGGDPFLVKNVVAPACLLWTPINYHALSGDDPEMLSAMVISAIPTALLSANSQPRGVLLFADGGEPKRSWRSRVGYQTLLKEAEAGFHAWVRIDAKELKTEPEESHFDGILMALDEDVVLLIVAAKERGDPTLARRNCPRSAG
jgi:hypothetical protein